MWGGGAQPQMSCEKEASKTHISPKMRFFAWESKLLQAVLASLSESVLLFHHNKAPQDTHQPVGLGPRYNQGTVNGEPFSSLQVCQALRRGAEG